MDSQAWLWFSELVMLMKKSSHYFKAFYLFIYCFCHTYRPSKKITQPLTVRTNHQIYLSNLIWHQISLTVQLKKNSSYFSLLGCWEKIWHQLLHIFIHFFFFIYCKWAKAKHDGQFCLQSARYLVTFYLLYSRFYCINTGRVAFIPYDSYHENILQFFPFVKWKHALKQEPNIN